MISAACSLVLSAASLASLHEVMERMQEEKWDFGSHGKIYDFP